MAAPCGQSQYSVEIHFAQRLASNEKKIRDRAVKRLRHWIAARSQKDGNIGESELMKLWKGLFYCMWMCDKAVIQEELADQISDMAHCFRRPEEACLFFETFLATMRREWMGIDHLRMDKYLMLIRRSFRQMLVVLHNNEWDQELVKVFLTSLSRCALNPAIDACPDGLRYQIANVYLDELAREGTEELSPQQASIFLFPFAELVAKTLNKKLRDVILQDIFQDVVERSDVGEEAEEEEDEGIASDEERKKVSKNAIREKKRKRRRKGDDEDDDDEEEEEEEELDDVDILEKVMFPEEMVPPLQYDYGMIGDKLFDLASEKTIPPRNRKPIYRMVKRFQSLAKGVYPMPDLLKQIREEKDNEYLKDELPWWKKLQEREKKKNRRRKRRRGKKGGKVEDGEEEDGDDNDDEGEEEEEEEDVVVKKKRKVQKKDDDETEEDTKKKRKKQKKSTKLKEPVEEEATGADFVEEITDAGSDFTELKSLKTKGKKKKGKRSKGEDETVIEEQSVGEEFEQMTEAVVDFTELISLKTEEKKKKGKKSRSEEEPIGEESVQSEPAHIEESVTSETPSQIDASKRKKKKGATKNGSEKSNTDIDSDLTLSTSNSEMIGDSQADIDACIEDAILTKAQTPRTKSKKKGKKNSPKSDDNDTNGMDLNTTIEDWSKGSKVKSGKREGSPKPFAAFEKVSTPMAYVKKAKATVPSTLPRAKSQSRIETQFSPPMTRKRVKIALSKNQFQAANEYKQKIKLSPGVPFDGSKKPAFSVLKQTPPRPEVTGSKVKGSAKKSGKVEKRRARATDFF